MVVLRKTIIGSSQVTYHESMRMSPKQNNSTPCVFEDEPIPTKVVCGRSTLKRIVACFIGKTDHVAAVPLEHRRTVNSEWYTTICLPKVFVEIRKTNKKRRIIIYHDNTSCHTSAQSSAFLTCQNVELMGHPQCSPDLAPNDFFFFPSYQETVCCGVRGRALASHTDVRGFEPQCGGRLSSLIC